MSLHQQRGRGSQMRGCGCRDCLLYNAGLHKWCWFAFAAVLAAPLNASNWLFGGSACLLASWPVKQEPLELLACAFKLRTVRQAADSTVTRSHLVEPTCGIQCALCVYRRVCEHTRVSCLCLRIFPYHCKHIQSIAASMFYSQ